MSEPNLQGGVVLGGDPYLALPNEVKQRVAMDVTATTLVAEAKHQLYRAQLLFVNDVGHWVDQEANADLAGRIEIALKILDGGKA